MRMYQTIKIVMLNGGEVMWEKDEWNDYYYDGKFFIPFKLGSSTMCGKRF